MIATATDTRRITGGVDTHLDVHVAAALDHLGTELGTKSFPTTPASYGSSSGGCAASAPSRASVSRHRQFRRRPGPLPRQRARGRRRGQPAEPSGAPTGRQERPIDAVAAAHAALAGSAAGEAKGRNGNIECIRVLRVARRGARLDACAPSTSDVIATAPDQLREQLRSLPRKAAHQHLRRSPSRHGARRRGGYKSRSAGAGEVSARPRGGTSAPRRVAQGALRRDRPRPCRTARCRHRHRRGALLVAAGDNPTAPDDALLRFEHAGDPGVDLPGPPEKGHREQPPAHGFPGRVLRHERGALVEAEDKDKVEEQLQRYDRLPLPTLDAKASAPRVSRRHCVRHESARRLHNSRRCSTSPEGQDIGASSVTERSWNPGSHSGVTRYMTGRVNRAVPARLRLRPGRRR